MVVDRRKKGCLNPACDKCINEEKYETNIQFCPMCGHKLVLVCVKCHKRIEDRGPDHRICNECMRKKKEDKNNAKSFVKDKVVGGFVASGEMVYKAVIKQGGKKVIDFIKKPNKKKKKK